MGKYNSERQAEWARRQRDKLKDLLGGKCACCGESEYMFLQVDHVNNDGAAHRKRIGRSSLSVNDLKKYIEEGGLLQLLCGNCHNAKSYFGTCPHMKEK